LTRCATASGGRDAGHREGANAAPAISAARASDLTVWARGRSSTINTRMVCTHHPSLFHQDLNVLVDRSGPESKILPIFFAPVMT